MFETKDGRERAERISGPMRVSLVNDLALGTKTHRQLAVKYHRSLDAIHQFASRNAEEINAAKREMSEPIEYWGAQKDDQIAILSAQVVELGERYKADGLTAGQEARFRSQLAKLVHQMSELTGHLMQRSTPPGARLLLVEEVGGWDTQDPVSRHRSALDVELKPEPEPASEPEPSPMPEQEPEAESEPAKPCPVPPEHMGKAARAAAEEAARERAAREPVFR